MVELERQHVGDKPLLHCSGGTLIVHRGYLSTSYSTLQPTHANLCRWLHAIHPIVNRKGFPYLVNLKPQEQLRHVLLRVFLHHASSPDGVSALKRARHVREELPVSDGRGGSVVEEVLL